MLHVAVRKIRGIEKSKARFTKGVQSIVVSIQDWNWASILTKVNLLVILYWILSVCVAKLTFVFLSWLNEALTDIALWLVIFTFFIIGYLMFLLPPIPGVPVYMCSGIVIAARANKSDGPGYVWGIIIAIFVSFTLKLAAVCGQYAIGYMMGKSVRVQQIVGVDKVITRALEQILLAKGLDLAKVSVLVGGPDWPTSVLCGILKLNVFQCVLGTTPVIVLIFPCVIAGAFLSGPGAEDPGSIWGTL